MTRERIEAAAKAMAGVGRWPGPWSGNFIDQCREIAVRTLTAADAADATNGIHRINLDDAAVERGKVAVHHQTSHYFSNEGIASEDAEGIVRAVLAALVQNVRS
ncbi:hypothetical protein ANMWB30_24820 [Arthrobacter sp. MWB30]|nr:hypothetical protein ANMWB30_24820 [Arthrobacter sp. MWB30]